MKKAKLIFAFAAFLVLNIYCVKSNETQAKKTNTATLAVDGGCTCSDNDSSGTYTPTVTAFNISGVGVQDAIFTKVKNVVTVDGRFIWQSATSTGKGVIVSVTLPIQSPTPLVAGKAFGTCNIVEDGSFVNGVYVPTLFTTRSFINQSPGDKMQIIFNVQTTQSGGAVYFHFVYKLTPAQ